MRNPVMATNQKGFQRTGIGIFHRRMLGPLAELPQRGRADPQQPAYLAGSIDRPRLNGLGLQQGLEQGFGLTPEIGGRLDPASTAQTAQNAFLGAHTGDPLPGATAHALLRTRRPVYRAPTPTPPASPSPLSLFTSRCGQNEQGPPCAPKFRPRHDSGDQEAFPFA